MEAYITLVMTGRWLDIMCTYRFIIFKKKFALISTVSHPLFFLCSEEELPYHNAAMERVSPVLCSFFITEELHSSEKEKLPLL